MISYRWRGLAQDERWEGGGCGIARNLKLRAARVARDMTQKELADAVGVSRQTINAIEQGDYNPTIRLCRAICRALGRSLDDLFGEEEENETQ